MKRRTALIGLAMAGSVLAGCQFQPLHGSNSATGNELRDVTVGLVDTRVGLQVRNRLLFLLNGGNAPLSPKYRADLTVTSVNKTLASTQNAQDRTVGQTLVRVSYNLINVETSKQISSGTRQATASYDRINQSFANSRAQRDAENRAAKEAAESIRLAIAGDLNR